MHYFFFTWTALAVLWLILYSGFCVFCVNLNCPVLTIRLVIKETILWCMGYFNITDPFKFCNRRREEKRGRELKQPKQFSITTWTDYGFTILPKVSCILALFNFYSMLLLVLATCLNLAFCWEKRRFCVQLVWNNRMVYQVIIANDNSEFFWKIREFKYARNLLI